MNKEKIQQIGLNIVALLIGCSIFFGLLEFVVRVWPLEGKVFITLDPCVGHINKPMTEGVHVFADSDNFVQFNYKGFHDVEHLVPKKEGAYRIAILGDSFVEGLQVQREELFSRILEKKLNEMNISTEVISFGISSYGTDQQLMMYRCVARMYKPDLVLLAFSANDSGDNYFKKSPYKPNFRLENENLILDNTYVSNILERIKDRTSLSLDGLFFFVKENSYAARFLKKKYDILNASLNAGDDKISPRNTVALLRIDEDIEQTNAWRLTERLLMQVRNEVASDGAKFAIIKIPGQPEFISEFEKMSLSKDVYDPTIARSRLMQIAKNINASYLDLQEDIELNGGFEELYFPIDRHWKPEGHKVAAESVSKFIISSKMLK